MSTSAERSATIWPGLLEKLMAVVRSEFRIDLYVPAPEHPVLGRGTCPVTDCDRSPTEHGLCSTHGNRWRERGRPALTEFLADPGPPINGRRDLTGCTVPGCRYGSSGFGLCLRHRSAWKISGHTDPAIWASTALAAAPADRSVCGLPFCSLWIENTRNLFCYRIMDLSWIACAPTMDRDSLVSCLSAGTGHHAPADRDRKTGIGIAAGLGGTRNSIS